MNRVLESESTLHLLEKSFCFRIPLIFVVVHNFINVKDRYLGSLITVINKIDRCVFEPLFIILNFTSRHLFPILFH